MVLGSIALAILAQRTVHVALIPAWYVVVPLVVWAVYTLDRLIDVRNDVEVPATDRHQFTNTHRTALTIGVVAALVTAASIAVVAFPASYWFAAIILGGLTLLHLLLQRSRSATLAIIKDVNVAVTFTAASWAIPLIDVIQREASISTLPIMLSCFACCCLVMADVSLLSRLDADTDRASGQPSIATTVSPAALMSIIAALLTASAASGIALVVIGDVAIGSLIVLMAALYVALSRTTSLSTTNMRLAIELVLVLPLMLM